MWLVRTARKWRGAKYLTLANNWIMNIRLKLVSGIRAVTWPQTKLCIHWNYSFINGCRLTLSISWCSALANHDCKYQITRILKWKRKLNKFENDYVACAAYKDVSVMVWMSCNSLQHANGISVPKDFLLFLENLLRVIKKCKLIVKSYAS